MQYQEWIKAKDELSPADRQAFEHELQDNPRLQAEQAAFDLTNELLGAAAQGLSEKAILQGNAAVSFPYKFLVGSVMAALLLTFGIYALIPDFEAPQSAPATEVEQQETSSPSAADLELEEAKEQIAPAEQPPVAAVEKTQPSPAVAKPRKSPSTPSAVVVKTVQSSTPKSAVELDRPVEEEEVVAEEVIILKPGFHAKAGTRFSAKVEPENVLNR